MRSFLLCVLCVLCGESPLASAPLPLGKVPPGKVFLVVLPHHDDHTWEYGFGGLIAKFADAGYTGYYVRVSNDEKDGAGPWYQNDIINHRECLEAVRFLGMKDVISLNWRNDHSDSVPLDEIRAQLVLLIRKYKPDAVMAYNPWGHYDRNPDHRKTAHAVAEAVFAAGNPNFYPEHLKLGLQPHRVLYRYFSQRSDYGHGYDPNIAFELTPAEMQRKAQAYWMNRNVRLHASLARSIRAQFAKAGMRIPELDGLSDLDAAKKLQEWRMYWISEKRGKENGVKYAEVFYEQGAFDDLPGLKDYALGRSAPAPPPGPAPAVLAPRKASRVLVVTPHADDYLLYAGGTLARLIAQGAEVRVLRVTNDEKQGRGITPQQAAGRNGEEAEQAARALGVKEVISLGYRAGELAAVSPTELRDRILFYIRLDKPDVLFIPNPDTHYDDNLDHYYAGSAAEEARWAAAVHNFEPPFALAGLRCYLTPELYYYAPPVDPRRREAESTATFTPQPKIVDIAATFDRKLRALRALHTLNRSVAMDLKDRLAATGRHLPLLDAMSDDAVSRLAEIRLRSLARQAAQGSSLSLAEEFEYAGPEFQTPAAYRASR